MFNYNVRAGLRGAYSLSISYLNSRRLAAMDVRLSVIYS